LFGYWLQRLLAVLVLQRLYRRLFINEAKIPFVEDSDIEDPQMDNSNMGLFRMGLAATDRDFDSNDYETLLRLDDPNEQKFMRGADISDISRLPKFQIPGTTKIHGIDSCNESLKKQMLDKQCCICLDNFESNDVVVTIPCLVESVYNKGRPITFEDVFNVVREKTKQLDNDLKGASSDVKEGKCC
jgi:hypothetical protein